MNKSVMAYRPMLIGLLKNVITSPFDVINDRRM